MKKILKSFKLSLSKVVCLLALINLVACGDEKIQSEQLQEEMQGREIKRITDGEFMRFADEIGQKLSDSLLPYIDKDNFVITKKGKEILKEAKDTLDFDFKLKSDKSKMADKESLIYESYVYSIKNNQEIQVTPQYLEKSKTYIYAVPVQQDTVFQGVMTISIPKKTLVVHYPAED